MQIFVLQQKLSTQVRRIDEKLKERFFSTYKFSNHDNNKFVLLLRKGVDPHECMDNSKKFNETLHLKKKIFAVT